jgi:hypothetical protein
MITPIITKRYGAKLSAAVSIVFSCYLGTSVKKILLAFSYVFLWLPIAQTYTKKQQVPGTVDYFPTLFQRYPASKRMSTPVTAPGQYPCIAEITTHPVPIQPVHVAICFRILLLDKPTEPVYAFNQVMLKITSLDQIFLLTNARKRADLVTTY